MKRDANRAEIAENDGSRTSDATSNVVLRRELIAQQSSFSGPLPPPEVLRAYNDVSPGLADRIIAMAERQSEHRQQLERTVVVGGAKRAWWGLWLGFAVSVLLICAGTWLIYNDHDVAGSTVLGIDVVALAGVFVFGKSDQRRERETKAEAERQPKRPHR